MGKRVDWTEHEQDELYTASVSLFKENPKMRFLEGVRMAQIVLQPGRKRTLSTISNIPKPLRDRFVLNGFLSKDWEKMGRRVKRVPDTTVSRVSELEETIKLRDQEIEALKTKIESLMARPAADQVVQAWIARTISLALIEANAANKPEAQTPLRAIEAKLREPIPDFERQRRKDPTGFTVGMNNKSKTRFALISEFDNVDKGRLHNEIQGFADIRYIDALDKFGTLGRFNADGGRIITWNCPEVWEKSLQLMGLSFHRHKGPQSTLVQHIKDSAK